MKTVLPFLPPNGYSNVKVMYGDFAFHELSGGNVQIEGTWEAQNLITLRNVASSGLNVRIHKRLAVWFSETLEAAMEEVPTYQVRMLGGFCARHKMHNVTRPLSIHTWGAAVDINWDTNPPGAQLRSDIPDAFVAVFRERGWNWGGDWKGEKDPMHFQYATGV